DRSEILPPGFRSSLRCKHLLRLSFMGPPSGGVGPGFQCGTVGDSVEPIPQRPPPVEDISFANQYQECGLESVLCVLCVGQDPFTNAQHERPITAHQCSKRGIVPVPYIPFQELTVRQLFLGRPTEKRTEVLPHVPDSSADHLRGSPSEVPSS